MAKGPDAFRTISEAADALGTPQHVLRFWESKFSFIRPMKRAGGRRFYRPQDIEVLKSVRTLLHEQGYTIKGVQRLHREHGLKGLTAAASGEGPAPTDRAEPESQGSELQAAEPQAAQAAEPQAAEPAAAPSESARLILGDSSRERLQRVLADLEGVKDHIDGLMAK